MNYKIIFTNVAENDLRSILNEVLKVSGDKETAFKFIKDMQKKINELEVFPDCYPIIKDNFLKRKNIRFLNYKKYLIFYIIRDKQIIIETILNSKRDYVSILKECVK